MKPCNNCNSPYWELTENPNYIGMCVACECQKEYEAWETEVEYEFKIYNEQHATGHDYDTFYNACYAGEIELDTLAGLEELTECFHAAIQDKAHAEWEAAQPPFDPNDVDLPF